MTMQLPGIGKVRQPAPWLLGLVAAGILGTGTAVVVIARQQAAPIDVSALTVPVESKSLTVRITSSGSVEPIQTVNLSPKTSGILAELLVEQGDRVQQGQVIARMEGDTIVAELAQAQAQVDRARADLARIRSGNRPQEIAQGRATVEQARASVEEARARLTRAQDKAERNRQLVDQGAIAQDTYEDVLNEVATARATLEQRQATLRETEQRLSLTQSGSRQEEILAAEARVKEAVANFQQVQVRQQDLIIRAPFDGIITQKYATEGAFVTPTTSASNASSATSTAIVALANGLEILAEVPEVDIDNIRVGQAVEIVADAFPDDVYQGRVRLVAPEAVVRQNVTTFQVRVALTTGQEKLLSGMNVDLTFLGDRLDNAVVVPTVAIVTKGGQTGVLLPGEANKPEFRPVTPGVAIGDQTQITEGLQVGERVFIDLPASEQDQWMNPNANPNESED